MEVKIKPPKNSSITKEITLELGGYTILAGENNSGKTNLVKAINDHKDLAKYKKIFIPAENIQPQNEVTKASAATTEFFKLLKSILEPIFDKDILKGLVDQFDKSQQKKEFVAYINGILKDFGIEKKKFDIKIAEDKFKEDIIIKITKAFVRDLYATDIEEVDFENIGIGTQRLIVAALIRYYQEKEIGKDEEVLIIFEEPEAYLHPKWKRNLYNSLCKLSERKNTKVLITTHDPYFIELGKKQKIYQVFRDSDNKDTTAIKLLDNIGILPYKSDSEVNCLVFDIPSKTYFLELYEHLLSFFPVRALPADVLAPETSFKKLNAWIISKAKAEDIEVEESKPLVSKLRHQLSHPKKEVEESGDINEENLSKRIKEAKKLISIAPRKETAQAEISV